MYFDNLFVMIIIILVLASYMLGNFALVFMYQKSKASKSCSVYIKMIMVILLSLFGSLVLPFGIIFGVSEEEL